MEGTRNKPTDEMYQLSMNYMRLPKRFKENIDILLDLIIPQQGIEEIILFGSCARKRPKESSDIDLAIVYNDGFLND